MAIGISLALLTYLFTNEMRESSSSSYSSSSGGGYGDTRRYLRLGKVSKIS